MDNLNSVNSTGFEDFIGQKANGKIKKNATAIGANVGRWPTADQIADSIKKSGMGGSPGSAGTDTARTSLQFLDPAYFDPLLFYIQHRDRRELNFRLRHAYEYEPIVGNLIDLHRTMPLSSYSLSCADKSIEREMSEFAERIEFLPLSSYILGDYFLLGESIWFLTWDDMNKTWKEITLLPPEKIELRRSYLTKTPLMMLHVDSDLKRLVNSGDEMDKAIVAMMDPDLVAKLRSQDRIFLPPTQVHHFANKTSESDLRGTSVLKRGLYALLLKYKIRMLHNAYMDRGTYPLRIFKVGSAESHWVPNRSHFEALRNQLAAAANDPSYALLYHYGLSVETVGGNEKWADLLPHYNFCDKEIMAALFSSDAMVHATGTTYCFDDKTEILTDNGWKKHDAVAPEDKVGTFNDDTKTLEFQKPSAAPVYDYAGEMIHFQNNCLDVCVTPNHRMLYQTAHSKEWVVKEAQEISGANKARNCKGRFRACAENWKGARLGVVKIGKHEIPAETYLKFAGYYISEGSMYWAQPNGKSAYKTQIAQAVTGKHHDSIAAVMEAMPIPVHRAIQQDKRPNTQEIENFVFCSEELAEHVKNNFPGKAHEKRLPKFIRNLPKDQLRILLGAMVEGDGRIWPDSKHNRTEYSTVSKGLADDVQEILLKLGYAPRLVKHDDTKGARPIYRVTFSNGPLDKFPSLRKLSWKNSPQGAKQEVVSAINRVPYKGKVWCFTVPNHFLVTRRNGIISIQGNSNANVSVRVLLSRYQMIRNMLELAWKNKVFRPMCQAREYYIPDRTGNTGMPTINRNGKYYYLDVPKVKWSKINLLDDVAQKQFLLRLRERMEIPHKLIAEIFDLDPDDLKEQLRGEEGSCVDPSVVEAKKKALAAPGVVAQVLQGVKSKEWVLPTDVPEEEAKKKKVQKDIGSPAAVEEITSPKSTTPPALPAGPRPSASEGIPTPTGTPQSALPASPAEGPVTKSPI